MTKKCIFIFLLQYLFIAILCAKMSRVNKAYLKPIFNIQNLKKNYIFGLGKWLFIINWLFQGKSKFQLGWISTVFTCLLDLRNVLTLSKYFILMSFTDFYLLQTKRKAYLTNSNVGNGLFISEKWIFWYFWIFEWKNNIFNTNMLFFNDVTAIVVGWKVLFYNRPQPIQNSSLTQEREIICDIIFRWTWKLI